MLARTLKRVLVAPAAATAILASTLAAQSVYQQIEVGFAGFSHAGDAQYQIAIRTAPFKTTLRVKLRDAMPSPIDPVCHNEWRFAGESVRPRQFGFKLEAGFWYRGPVYLDAYQNGYRVLTVGPLQLPKRGSGLTPYGATDLDRNRLSLIAAGEARSGSGIVLSVAGAPAGASGVVAVAPSRTNIQLSLGGRLLIGPTFEPLSAALHSDSDGSFQLMLALPDDRRLEGASFCLQAACDSMDDGPEPWFFSNAIQVDVLKRD